MLRRQGWFGTVVNLSLSKSAQGPSFRLFLASPRVARAVGMGSFVPWQGCHRPDSCVPPTKGGRRLRRTGILPAGPIEGPWRNHGITGPQVPLPRREASERCPP